MADKPKGKIEFDEGLHINRIPGNFNSASTTAQKNIFEQALQELKEDENEDEITVAKSIFDEIVEETEREE